MRTSPSPSTFVIPLSERPKSQACFVESMSYEWHIRLLVHPVQWAITHSVLVYLDHKKREFDGDGRILKAQLGWIQKLMLTYSLLELAPVTLEICILVIDFSDFKARLSWNMVNFNWMSALARREQFVLLMNCIQCHALIKLDTSPVHEKVQLFSQVEYMYISGIYMHLLTLCF